ncbi:MAG: amidohydrolase family protein, partial [Planctomycetes bacterium]|nr:amidohydrolase family protein [Planctomycetota bacterium]
SGELLQFAWQMKSSKRLCLVSDCNRALDMPPGKYAFGDLEDAQWLVSDGKVGRGSNGALASSVVGMDTMVQTMKRLTSVPLHEIVRMASLTPAERTGISDSFGSIAFGKAADLLILTNQLEVHSVFIGGECVLTKD